MPEEPDLKHLASTETTLRSLERLLALTKPEFPKVLSNDAPIVVVVSAALCARAVGTIEAIMRLAPLRRRTDLAALTRNLYEHIVVLAWLLIEPKATERVGLWQRSDYSQRLKVDGEMKQIGKRGLAEPAWLAAKVASATGSKRMPDIASLWT